MKKPRLLPVIFLGFPALGLAGENPPQHPATVDLSPPAASLDRGSLPAVGTQSALLTVTRFGRYAVTVSSAQGMGLRLVDRMAGPGQESGSAGERDGRLDVFLERGEYKVVASGHRKAQGTARLAVRPFTDKNPKPPLLPELKLVSSTLGDFEQASYWIEIPSRRRVAIEAAGRALADLRLWKDGAWLMDVTPDTQVVQPAVGHPLLLCRLAADLEPGLYLLTAYGGPPQAWAEESEDQPFHLRMGIPRLGSAGRQRHVVSPFGVDRYLVPGSANYFRLELPEARPAKLGTRWYEESEPFALPDSLNEITKKSAPPVAENSTAINERALHVVTVEAPAGQAYVLQHFQIKYEDTLRGSGNYWVSSIRSGHPQDSVDATAIMVHWQHNARGIEPLLTATVELDAATGWSRRANLLGTLTVYLHIKDTGTYEALVQGVQARFRIEPFLVTRPQGYQSPPFRGSGSLWDLDSGYYVLTVEPETVGVAELALKPKGLLDAALQAVGFGRGAPAPRPVRSDVRFTDVTLDQDESYTIYLNQAPEVRAGIVVRMLPLDLTDPLVVAQLPGEAVEVPFKNDERGLLRAETVSGQLLDVAVDGGGWQTNVTVEPGRHRVAVRHSGADTIQYALALEPLRLRAETPLPPLPDSARAALPDFPVLTETAARPIDLGRDSASTLIVKANAPALYRLETTGLLATGAVLRTRTVTELATAEENGTGRNALMQEYLREGDYQVTVKTRGRSAGHLGVSLRRTRLLDGGYITNRIPARVTLEPGEAVAYRFKITKPGEFRVRSLGLSRSFRCRIEDEGGWPLLPPGGEADITRSFEPGTYRLVILPQATRARAVTLIEPVARPRRLKGHGPHALALARPVDNLWTEPEAGAERLPDVFDFNVPAPLTAEIQLSGGMEGRLLERRVDGSTVEVATIAPNRGFRGALAAGDHRLEVRSSRRDNRAPYQLAVWPEELVPGLDREVTAPAVIPVSLATTDLVELTSFGAQDVRARLFSADSRLVTENDDRPDDWNFAISASLTAGRYELRIDPVGAASANCTVSVRARSVVEKPPLTTPAAIDLALGRETQVFPLALQESAEIVLVDLRSAESVGLALEAASGDLWRSLATTVGRGASIEVPLLQGSGRYRLRVWSVDRRGLPAKLRVASGKPPRVTEKDLARGVVLAPLAGPGPHVGVAVIDLDRAGLLQSDERPRWSTTLGTPCRPVGNSGVVSAVGKRLFVTADLPPSSQSMAVRASRLTLPSRAGQGLLVDVPAGTTVAADLPPSQGPVLVWAVSETAQPGVRVIARGEPLDPSGDSVAVATRAAAAVSLRGGDSAALLWPATAPGDAFEARLESRSFAPPARQSVTAPATEGPIAAGAARRFDLPDGAKRLRLALDEGVVAVLSKGDRIESVHWAGDGPTTETVFGDPDRLTLLNPTLGETRFALESTSLSTDALPAPLLPGHTDERAAGVTGMLRVAVGPVPGSASVHVRGDIGDATFIGRDGRIARGRDLPVGEAGGSLLVPHGPGLLLAWADRPGQEAPDLWAQKPPTLVDLKPPASVALHGPSQGFRVKADGAGLLRLRTAVPAVIMLQRGGETPEIEVQLNGADREVYLPTGQAEIRLRAVSGGALWGSAEIGFTSATPIEEGLGPEVLLPPGTTALFSFEVKREGPVGIGVRASVDSVVATLLTSQGERLGTGVVQMQELKPGTYLLALRAAQDAAPVRARPAVAGLALPDTGPPADVVRSYLEPQDAALSFSARRATPASVTRTGEGESAGSDQQAQVGEAEGEEEGDAQEEDIGEEPGDDGQQSPAQGGAMMERES